MIGKVNKRATLPKIMVAPFSFNLFQNEKFREDLKKLFERKETRMKWFPNNEEVNKFIAEKNKFKNLIKELGRDKIGNGIRLNYEIDSVSIPDLFSFHKGRKIIGDAKYYNDPEGSDYDKEFRTYNELSGNKYPMLILGPGMRTRPLHVRKEGNLELVIFEMSIKEVIEDAVNNTNISIDKIHMFLWSKGYTER